MKIEKDDFIIDCGAHVGVFTIKAAKEASEGTVIAIEPHPFNMRLLKLNTILIN